MNNRLLAIGMSLFAFGIFLLWSVAATAQQPQDAPLVLVTMETRTPLTDTPSGIVEVVMTMQMFEESGNPGPIVGYIFDASVAIDEFTAPYELSPAYIWYGSQLNPPPGRVCFLELYYAVIPEWTAEEPAYVLGNGDLEYCDGPIPTFAEFY